MTGGFFLHSCLGVHPLLVDVSQVFAHLPFLLLLLFKRQNSLVESRLAPSNAVTCSHVAPELLTCVIFK